MLFLTLQNVAMIVAEAGEKRHNQITVKWVYDTSTIKYVEVNEEDASLTIGFDEKTLNIKLEEVLLA